MSSWWADPPTVVCAGQTVDDQLQTVDDQLQTVDDQLQPEGDRCGARYTPPTRTADRLVAAHPLADVWRPTTPAQVVEMARAAGWAVAPRDFPDHGEAELVGTCPACRRPPAAMTALAKERNTA